MLGGGGGGGLTDEFVSPDKLLHGENRGFMLKLPQISHINPIFFTELIYIIYYTISTISFRR